MSYIEDQIAKTTNWSGQKTLTPLVKLLLPHPWAERRRLIAKIARASGYQVADVRDFLLKVAGEAQQKSDPGIEIVEITLSKYFDSEDRVVNAADQKFWIFRKTHWHPMPKNIMLQYIMQSADYWQVRHPENRAAVSTLMGQAERIMVARLASEIDLNSKQPPANVVNVRNGELYFDSKNGTYELKPHDPANFHTSCLNVDWNPKAKCDRFDQFLLEVFSMSVKPEDTIRHLWELIGYTMQGHKDLASWILLTGEGANGKTTLLKALTALLGSHAQNASVTEIAGNPHGINDLVGKLALIDEDLSSKYKLPDSFLKKISENKQMRANPKYETPFNFENRAIVWMATNVLPATDDVSHGMIRRAHVLHFGRKFLEHEQDKTLDATFAGPELPGIFRRAVEGLCRLRKRGQWDIPSEIQTRIKSWSTQASPLALWHHECVRAVKKSEKSYVALKDLYSHYVLWCDDQNLKYTHSKPIFRKRLESVGMDFARISGDILVAMDIRLAADGEMIIKGL